MCRHSETEEIPYNDVTLIGFTCINNICYGMIKLFAHFTQYRC